MPLFTDNRPLPWAMNYCDRIIKPVNRSGQLNQFIQSGFVNYINWLIDKIHLKIRFPWQIHGVTEISHTAIS